MERSLNDAAGCSARVSALRKREAGHAARSEAEVRSLPRRRLRSFRPSSGIRLQAAQRGAVSARHRELRHVGIAHVVAVRGHGSGGRDCGDCSVHRLTWCAAWWYMRKGPTRVGRPLLLCSVGQVGFGDLRRVPDDAGVCRGRARSRCGGWCNPVRRGRRCRRGRRGPWRRFRC